MPARECYCKLWRKKTSASLTGVNMVLYDIAVIGKGLIGSAALRHLSQRFPELALCAIGPDEPQDRKTHDGVFASHYDQGRITRVLDPSPLWGNLARQAIAQYPLIERSSGIQFHHRVGCLRAADLPERIAELDACAAQLQPPHQRLDAAGCRAAYPFLAFSDDFVAWDEGGAAGYINPRSLIAAQLKIAADHGATILREIVTQINCQDNRVEIHTRAGGRLQARKALLTAGGYSNTLLRRKLALETKAHTILLAQVPLSEVARLRHMPSVISSFRHQEVASLYMLPPLPYPDGKTYIKLGMSGRPEELPAPEHFLDATENDQELLAWFRGDGREDIAAAMKSVLHRMIPDLQVISYHSVPCLITNTAHGKPYIDALEDGKLFLATGGNGAAAKSSDEIGRIGAMLCATGHWHSDLAREDFRLRYADHGSKSK